MGKRWNFDINPEKAMDTFFGIDKELLFSQHKTDNKELVYKNYYDTLLNRYHICSRFLPYDILDPRADEYMSNPKVTCFGVPYYQVSDEKIKAYYEKLKTNPVWFNKASSM